MNSKNLAGLSDHQLFALIKKNNQLAFAAIYDKYWESLYSIAYRKTGSSQETEDLLHEVFMDLWKNRQNIEIRKSFAAYIATALKYKIFRLIDAQNVRKKHAGSVSFESRNMETTPENQLSFEELYDLIEESIEKLPQKCKSVFRLSRGDHQTVKEIATTLNISPHTAQNHINYALKKLRIDLQDYLTILIILCLPTL
ncbi:RNA polymerase sigma-70 factor [Fulvivirgaceae bacterium BMA12]|uniref:RNA polymerase sigma-70 factor n=1 Tax=Agaribacillus aureus TaxID=3051825 RepID=A0ABT8L6M7_9BACT|nr:RNA polymerase sigma-70 factor [Fulvivirgaceae bacterium BMA12]